MPTRQPLKLTKRAVDALAVESGDTVVWDRDLPGFGIRVYASGRKVWCVQTRGAGGGPKRFALGRYGSLTPDDARRKAALAIDRIKQGLEPVPPAAAPEPTVADLAERYMEAHVQGELPARDGGGRSGASCACTSCRSWGICGSRRWTVRRSRSSTTSSGRSPTRRTRRWGCWRTCSVWRKPGG